MAVSFEERGRRTVALPAALAIAALAACDASSGETLAPGDDASSPGTSGSSGGSGSSGSSGSSSTGGSGGSGGSSGTGSSSGGQPGDAAAAGPDAPDAASSADGPAAPDGSACAAQGSPAVAALPNLATRYRAGFTSPPSQTDTQETTDAPLLGNGDVGVAILGAIDAMTFLLGKTEFWSLSQGSVKAMSRLSLSIPGMAGASYSVSEDIGAGRVTASFAQGGNTIDMTSWVQATDSTNNALFTQLAYRGSASQAVTVSLVVGENNGNPNRVDGMNDVLYQDVQADDTDTVGGFNTHKVRVATRVVGTPGTVANGQLTFQLSPGQTVTLATGIMSNFDSSGYQDQVVQNVASLIPSNVASLGAAHVAWWDDFFRRSFVAIPDKLIEKEFYASLYLLASTSRTGEAPPGLWGAWVMKDPAWFSDYTLNYNYEVPFCMAFPTNHADLADSYDAPVIAWVPNAQKLATSHGWSGAYYRVHIGPLPNGSADTNEWNQKFNNAYAATIMIMHAYYTRHLDYERSIYDTLKQMAIFWASYLTFDGARYVDNDDAQHEGNPYPQVNGVMSLGLVRFLLQGTIDFSTDLGVDPDLRSMWQDRLSKLSAFPTFQRNGKTVFRYTEVGLDWNDGNSIGIQHIYPGSQIGLSSDPSTLQIAVNMVDEMARWSDGNGTNTFYPAAARVGYDPGTILSQLHGWVQNNTYPNLHIHTGGGGIENFNTVPATVSEMLVQSFQGVIRVFPDWPSGTDAKFANLAAYGGFLVASERSQGAIPYVTITSQNGGTLTVANPWPQGQLAVYRNGSSAPAPSGNTLTMQTAPCDVIVLAPAGTSYASVVGLMNAPAP
jgi:hypothetical protein